MKKPFFIVNPIAGGGRCAELFSEVKRLLSERGVKFSFAETERPRQSVELAAAAYDAGERLIIAVGGDGTTNEVASALYQKNDVTMGVFPFGTGNDFAKALRLPTKPDEAVELLLSDSVRKVDVCLANDTPFINVAGFGFDVDVLLNTEKYKKRYKGMLPYLLGIFKAMASIRNIPAKVTADGETYETPLMLADFGNGTHIGGGMAVTPEADPTDGKFDVCLVKPVSLATFLTLLPKFIKGEHIKYKKYVKYFRASEIAVECEGMPLNIDGEVADSTPVRFRMLHAALNIIAPKPSPKEA